MSRKRIHPHILAEETDWITQFVLNHVTNDAAVKATPLHEVYDDYCDYLARSNKGPTRLNVDGFGRLFPKAFERKVVNFDGKTLRAVVGVRTYR